MKTLSDLSASRYVDDNISRLDDFWRRKDTAPRYTATLNSFGHRLNFSTNDPRILDAAYISENRYTRQDTITGSDAINIGIYLDGNFDTEPVPERLPSLLQYLGIGSYLTIHAAPWVNSFCDLEKREGIAVISRALAAEPELLSRFILDCFVLNIMLQTGWGQLHASCLLRGEQTFLMSAPTNTGKSTTAFRLVENGWSILTDGMTYVRQTDRSHQLLGYPVGQLRLRMNMEPELKRRDIMALTALVREDRKFIVNLRELFPDRVIDQPVTPTKLAVCVLLRGGQPGTEVEQISPMDALDELWPEALHFDRTDTLVSNLKPVVQLIQSATCFRINLGTDQAKLLDVFQSLELD